MLFKDCLCFQIGRISRKMMRVTREKLIPYGLTSAQFFLLTALYEEDGLPISVLAQKVALDKATLTGLIDRLERDDLIRRISDPDDRRAIRIFLTPKSERLRTELTELYHENNRLFLSLLTSEEKEVFEHIVTKIDTAEFQA